MFVPFYGRSDSLESAFDAAIARGDLDTAWPLAQEMPEVRLDRALRLTMLAGRWGRRDYAAIVRAFLVRFILEVEPPTRAIKQTADALDVIGDPKELWIEGYAWKGMIALAAKIRAQDVGSPEPFYELPWGDW